MYASCAPRDIDRSIKCTQAGVTYILGKLFLSVSYQSSAPCIFFFSEGLSVAAQSLPPARPRHSSRCPTNRASCPINFDMCS
jgi:hypothetical protein